ncbi:MAG: aminotransferase class IV [Desulfobacter sp.]|nr:aminotransferase class IV [Desulfobacter sp.]
MKIVYVDGKFVPWDQAVIPVDDLAVLRGYAVCDIMRTIQGRPFFFDEHIQRLIYSAKKIGLKLPWSETHIKEIILKVLEKNPGIDEANIRVLITGGSSPDFFTPGENPRLIVLATDISRLPEHWYSKGIKVISHYEERALPDAKVTDYVSASLALKKAKKEGAEEAIYVTSNHLALEATTSNLFAFINNTLVTPAKGVLKGITRKAVLSLAQNLFTVCERPLPLSELKKAQEVFITGTNKGVVPVVQIDQTIIGNGKPGTSTTALIKAMNDHALAFKTPR